MRGDSKYNVIYCDAIFCFDHVFLGYTLGLKKHVNTALKVMYSTDTALAMRMRHVMSRVVIPGIVRGCKLKENLRKS